MSKYLKTIVIVLAAVIVCTGIAIPVIASVGAPEEVSQAAVSEAAGTEEAVVEAVKTDDQLKSSKAMIAGIVVGGAAVVAALAMAFAIGKSVDNTARQPEAAGKIQTMMMLGLVFIETTIIYALIVAILIIFVL